MASISDGVTTITISDDLQWIDEFDWNPVSQTTRRTIGGSFIVEESTLTHGRPITLEGGENVWMLRGTFNDIVTLASVPDKELTLTMPDSTTHNVIFRRDSQQPFEAESLWRKRTQANDDYMKNIILRFYEVA